MSEIKEFEKDWQEHGPLRAGEQSLWDLYVEYGEESELPHYPGVDPRQVPSDLDYQYRSAASEYEELAQEEAERQAELQHRYNLGRAEQEGRTDVVDPTAQHQAFVRDLPPGDRLKVQRIGELRSKIQDAAAQADLKRLQAERSGSGYVYDKLVGEAERLEFSARLDSEKLEEIQAQGFDTLKQDQDSAALQSAKQVLGVFEIPNVPLSHLDEKISEANRSPASFGYARRGNDELYKVSVEGKSIGSVFEGLRNDQRLENVPDHELLLTAADGGIAGHLYRVERIEPEDATRERVKESEIEPEPGGDIEVVRVGTGGEPDVTLHDQEEPKPEPDRTPKPKTHILSRL
jgi:hypothetical protein